MAQSGYQALLSSLPVVHEPARRKAPRRECVIRFKEDVFAGTVRCCSECGGRRSRAKRGALGRARKRLCTCPREASVPVT